MGELSGRTRADRILMGNVSPLAAKVEDAWECWSRTGYDHPLLAVLVDTVHTLARRYHHHFLVRMPLDDLQGTFWLVVAEVISRYDGSGPWYLLERVRKAIHSEAKDLMRRMNAARRRPEYIGPAPLSLEELTDEPASNDTSPETLVIRQEFRNELWAPMTDQQKTAVLMRSDGATLGQIGAHLRPSKPLHPFTVHRMLEGLRPHAERLAQEYGPDLEEHGAVRYLVVTPADAQPVNDPAPDGLPTDDSVQCDAEDSGSPQNEDPLNPERHIGTQDVIIDPAADQPLRDDLAGLAVCTNSDAPTDGPPKNLGPAT